MRGARTVIVGAFVVALTAAPTAASACTELGTDMSQATTNGIPVVEQQVLASSLPLLPFSGRTARMTVRAWGDLGAIELPSNLDFILLIPYGCRSPMEGWIGDRMAFQVWDDGAGRIELVAIVDAPGGLTEAQAAELTRALGEPVVTPPSIWDHIRAAAWAWWPHLAFLALLVLVFGTLFDALRRIARRVARARDRRQDVAST